MSKYSLQVNGVVFLLDKKLLDFLVTFNSNSCKPRKYPTPLGINTGGYLVWSPVVDGKRLSIPYHHLVIGKPIGKLEVDHINMDKTDNRLDNLRIVDRKTNANNRKVVVNKNGGGYV